MGAYADNDDIVPKLRAVVVGRFVATTDHVKGVPSLLELRAKTCWWTHLGDENAGTPQNLKPNEKSHRSHWVIIEFSNDI